MKCIKITKVLNFILLLIAFNLTILNADTQVNLNLKWKHQFQFAGFYTAFENGYYKDYGIDLKINEFTSTTLEDVLNGRIEFGISDSSILQRAIIGEPVVALLAILQESPRVLVSLKQNNIDSLLKLNNKIIEVPKLTSSSAEIYGMLKSYNINFQTKKTTFNINDLIAEKTDVISGYISNEPYLLKQKGYETNIIKPGDFGFIHFGDMLYTSKEYLKNNPILVENFVKATIKGWLYAFNNIEETTELILKKYNTQNKTKDALIYEANELKKLAGDLNRFGEISKSKAKQIFLGHSILFPNEKNNIIEAQNSIYEKNNELTVSNEKHLFLNEKEKEYLKNRQSINVGYALNFPPIVIKNNNQLDGIGIDLYKLIEHKLGVKFNYIISDWQDILKRTQAGEIDIVPLMNKNTANNLNLKSSGELYDLRVMVFAKKGNSFKINSIDDLENLKVAYNKNILVLDKYLSNYKDKLKLVPMNNEDQMFSLLNDDEVDAIIAFNISNYMVIKRILTDIKPIHTLKEPIVGSVSGIKPNDEILELIITKAVSSITTEDRQRITKKWLGDLFAHENNVLFTRDEKIYIKNNEFSLCEQHDIYPLSGVKDGKIIGMRGDYIDEIIKKSGLNFKVTDTNSLEELKLRVNNNQCDVIASLGSNQKIFPNLINTDVVMTFPYGVMGDIQSLNISPFTDLSDRTFIVRFENIANKIKKEYPNVNVIVINNIKEIMKKVGDKVHFVALKPVIEKVIQDYGFTQYKLNGILDKIDQKSTLGVSDKHPLLLEILNKTILSISPEFKNQILNKYSIKEFKVESNNKIYITIAVFLFILVVYYLRLDILNRIKQRKLLDSLVDKNSEISELNNSLQNILNQQNNIVVITDGKNLEYVNQKFFEFFEFKDLTNFKEKCNCIDDLFIKNDRYFHPANIKNNQNWINVLKDLPDNKRVVLFMSKDANLHAFSVSVNNFDTKKYVVSFTDISQTILSQMDLEQKTIKDKLTNAYNREFFEKHYEKFIVEYTLNSNHLAIVMLDIDHFKNVNDNYGHNAGDKVLINFVKTVQRFSRKDDILIRWGGEEFILILKVESEKTLTKILEHLRKAIELQENPEICKITCSFGGTLYKNDEDIGETIKRADEAVYEAKRNGRNLVVIK